MKSVTIESKWTPNFDVILTCPGKDSPRFGFDKTGRGTRTWHNFYVFGQPLWCRQYAVIAVYRRIRGWWRSRFLRCCHCDKRFGLFEVAVDNYRNYWAAHNACRYPKSGGVAIPPSVVAAMKEIGWIK